MTSLRRRATALPAVLLLALALTACGGSDDSSGGSDGGDSGGSSDGGTSAEDIPEMQGEACDADVELTGAVERTISTEGTVATSESDVAPPATYQVSDDGLVLTAYSGGNGFDPGLLITTDDTSYGMSTGAAGFEAAEDGSGFTADVEAGDVAGGDPVRVVATVTC